MAKVVVLVTLLTISAGNIFGLDICENEFSGTRLLYPTDCTKYIVCGFGEILSIQSCEEGKHFNRLTAQCDDPIIAACDVEVIKSILADSADCNSCRSACGCLSESNCTTPASPVSSTPGEPTPASPTPASSTPAAPTPGSPTPGSPTPASPSPAPTPASSTPAASTPDSSTPASSTPATPAPGSSTPASSTPAAPTPASSTPDAPASPSPASSTPAPLTPASSTPASSTPAPPSPSTPSPASPNPASPTTASPTPAPNPATPTTASPVTNASTSSPNSTCSSNLKICVGLRDYTSVYVPNTCHEYAICISGCANIFSCPNNLVYDISTHACTYPENIHCPYANKIPNEPSVGPSGTKCENPGKCQNQRDGTLFADEASNGYIICQCECEIARPCPANLVFNESLQVCDFPQA